MTASPKSLDPQAEVAAVGRQPDVAAEPSSGASPVPARYGPNAIGDPPAIPDYELLHPAGCGAYGIVWVARDRSGVLRALKVVELVRLPHADAGSREEEALALVRQRVPRHPHLVEIFHVGRQDGRLIYAMELADAAPGPATPEGDRYRADTLAGRIAPHRRLPMAEAVRLALDLLAALGALHDAGLVHRDVKPANIVFIGGVPKLADIGLAAVARTGLSVAGTPGYLPLDGSTGPDADLFALGKSLYQAVTGLAPCDFPAVPAEVLRGPEATSFRRLNRVLLRACAPTKAERFGSAGELRGALERVLLPRRPRARTVAAAMILAGMLILGGVHVWQDRPEEGPPAGPPATLTATTPRQRSTSDVLASLTAEPVDDALLTAVADLPPEDQVKVVAAKLQKLNPGFDGKMDVSILGRPARWVEDGKVTEVSFSTLQVSDLTPLKALPHLRRLYCGSRAPGRRGKLADLSPLRGMKLEVLWCEWGRVDDLAPLEGMPLTTLACMHNRIRDLRPLRDMPLQELYAYGNQIGDLTPLKGRPLRHLNCGANPVQDFEPVRGMRLVSLTAFETGLADLSVIADAPLEGVFIQKTKVTDLAPLKGKPLKVLNCGGNRIASLEPLRGLPLEKLWAWETDVTDISPLAGMKLQELALTGSPVKDFSPLRGMPLRSLHANINLPRDAPVLRSLPRLQSVNGASVKDVLK